MATLGDILQLLPDIGRNRLAYNPAFWPRAANALLSIIESEARGPDLYLEAFIPFNGRQTVYQVPSAMRKLLRVRIPNANRILDISDPGTEIPFTHRGDHLIQLAGPPGITPMSAMIIQREQSYTTVVSSTMASPTIPVPVSEGWGAIIRHSGGGLIEYRRIIGMDSTARRVTLDGPTVQIMDNGDIITLADQYMIFEGQKKLTRFTSEDSESPLPDEWNRILESGLRWKLEAQSDEEGASDASMQWYQQFRDALEAYAGDLAERPGDQNRIRPRGGSYWGILE